MFYQPQEHPSSLSFSEHGSLNQASLSFSQSNAKVATQNQEKQKLAWMRPDSILECSGWEHPPGTNFWEAGVPYLITRKASDKRLFWWLLFSTLYKKQPWPVWRGMHRCTEEALLMEQIRPTKEKRTTTTETNASSVPKWCEQQHGLTRTSSLAGHTPTQTLERETVSHFSQSASSIRGCIFVISHERIMCLCFGPHWVTAGEASFQKVDLSI